MYNQFSRVLVPIDGSEPSMNAAYRGVMMLRNKKDGDNSELIVIHVIYSEIRHVYSTYSFGGLISQSSIEEIIERAKRDIQTSFDKVQEEANKKEVRLRTEVIVNSKSIVGAIVDYAENEDVNLIVLGSRGLSGFKKLLLGSTASGVVTYAHCPVLVVK